MRTGLGLIARLGALFGCFELVKAHRLGLLLHGSSLLFAEFQLISMVAFGVKRGWRREVSLPCGRGVVLALEQSLAQFLEQDVERVSFG